MLTTTLFAAALLGPTAQDADVPSASTLTVLYVADPAHPKDRHRGFEGFLEQRFAQVLVTSHGSAGDELLEGVDVVVLDWKQQVGDTGGPCPLGEREAWSKPTVLIGSAGLMLAKKWEVLGGSG